MTGDLLLLICIKILSVAIALNLLAMFSTIHRIVENIVRAGISAH
jgi:hypothetical protein